MKRVGLLTCATVTQDLSCCSIACLQDCHESKGYYEKHASAGGSQMIGVISCAGCPTNVGHEKIMDKVRSLVSCGAEAIHISNCMKALCPFLNKYVALINKQFPHVDIVEGTHAPVGILPDEEFCRMTGELLATPRRTIPETIIEFIEEKTKEQAGSLHAD